MNLLSLDLSLNSTGYAIFNDNILVKSKVGIIAPPKKLLKAQKLSMIMDSITQIIELNDIEAVVIEDIFKGPSVKVFKILSMVHGIAILATFNAIQKEPVQINASRARKQVGCGRTKQNAFDYVVAKYGFVDFDFKKDNDRTDAIILGLSQH